MNPWTAGPSILLGLASNRDGIPGVFCLGFSNLTGKLDVMPQLVSQISPQKPGACIQLLCVCKGLDHPAWNFLRLMAVEKGH